MNSRRAFLKLTGGAAALGAISACTPSSPDSKRAEVQMFDFDQVLNREGSHSVKWDGRAAYFGTKDVLPMWVADMDFAAPPAVQSALAARVAHPVYGYTLTPETLFEAVMQWLSTRHDWAVEREWVATSPGVVPVLYAAVRAFTQEGEGVIVQSPVYTPFFNAVTDNHRRLILNPLRLEEGADGLRYSMDFEHLEQCAADGGKLLLLCSPHNPVGRVWREDELKRLLAIAEKYDMMIVSDEIHADLIYPGSARHIPIARLEDIPERVMTAVAPSKSFNIPGLGLAFMVVANPELRNALRLQFTQLHIETNNIFSLAAAEAAYQHGADWLDALMAYLKQTRDFVLAYCSQHLPGIRPVFPEGTYLMWLDCRALGLDDAALQRLFVRAGVGMSPGIIYGQAGAGFMRLNLGAPRSLVEDALGRMRKALAA